jgi:hypothetical protein
VLPWLAVGLGLGLAGCPQLDPEYCARHPQDVDCARKFGVRVDAGMCAGRDQCAYPTPVCDVQRSLCVACTATEIGACGGTQPVCGADDACHGCTADADCASQTCLPDGACAAALDLLYVAPTGSDLATCMPDDRCSLTRAIGLIDGTKSTIRLDPAHYDLLDTRILPHDLHLVGRGAVLDRNASGSGPVLIIANGTVITIDYVTVQGGDGPSGDGIQCSNAVLTLRDVTLQGNAARGLVASGCTLAISHAQIRNNGDVGIGTAFGSLNLSRSTLFANLFGGISTNFTAFDIENNLLIKNGGPSAASGAASFAGISSAPGHVFAFNTVAQNQAPLGTTAGVVCGNFLAQLTFTSNIVVDNGSGAQVEGASCHWIYSDIAPQPVPGTGNRSADPLFVDPVHNNFHLQTGSPARDTADPAATLAIDLDGDARPQGAGRDIGADEISDARGADLP